MTDPLNLLLLGLNQRSSDCELGMCYDLLIEQHRQAEADALCRHGYWVVRRHGPVPYVEMLKEGWREWRGSRDSVTGIRASQAPRVQCRWFNGPWRRFQQTFSQAVRDISPTGFEWGYVGQGPLALSMALLQDSLNMDAAQESMHQFCDGVVSQWDRQGWELHTLYVYTWLDLQPHMQVQQLLERLATGRRRTGGAQGGGDQ